MRKLITFIFPAVGGIAAIGTGYAQEMPPEVKAFLDNYTKDSTAKVGPIRAGNVGYFDSSVQIKDLKVRAIQTYRTKPNISIEAYPDTVALSELIEPTQFWNVFVMAGDKPLYQLELSNKTGKPEFVTRGLGPRPPNYGPEYKHDIWLPLLKAYPGSTGINPVLVTIGYDIEDSYLTDLFFYFKQKGPRKIYYAGSWHAWNRADTLRKIFTAPLEKLDDSRKLLAYWKKFEPEQKRLMADRTAEFRRRHDLEDDKKHKEYIDCYNRQPLRYGGRVDYYGDENQDSYINICIEEVKTGLRKERKVERVEVEGGNPGFKLENAKKIFEQDKPKLLPAGRHQMKIRKSRVWFVRISVR